MEFRKRLPGTYQWRQEQAAQAKEWWSMGVRWGHEISLADDPEEAEAAIRAFLTEDAPHLRPDSVVDAQEAIRDAMEAGPQYNQHVLCLGYDEHGLPSVVYL